MSEPDLFEVAAAIANAYRRTPSVTPEMVRSASQDRHSGDCIDEPASCLRCWADRYLKYARDGETPEQHRADYATVRAEVDRILEEKDSMINPKPATTPPTLWFQIESVERQMIAFGSLPTELPDLWESFFSIGEQFAAEKERLQALAAANGKVRSDDIIAGLALIGIHLKRAYAAIDHLAMQSRGETN